MDVVLRRAGDRRVAQTGRQGRNWAFHLADVTACLFATLRAFTGTARSSWRTTRVSRGDGSCRRRQVVARSHRGEGDQEGGVTTSGRATSSSRSGCGDLVLRSQHTRHTFHGRRNAEGPVRPGGIPNADEVRSITFRSKLLVRDNELIDAGSTQRAVC